MVRDQIIAKDSKIVLDAMPSCITLNVISYVKCTEKEEDCVEKINISVVENVFVNFRL